MSRQEVFDDDKDNNYDDHNINNDDFRQRQVCEMRPRKRSQVLRWGGNWRKIEEEGGGLLQKVPAKEGWLQAP